MRLVSKTRARCLSSGVTGAGRASSVRCSTRQLKYLRTRYEKGKRDRREGGNRREKRRAKHEMKREEGVDCGAANFAKLPRRWRVATRGSAACVNTVICWTRIGLHFISYRCCAKPYPKPRRPLSSTPVSELRGLTSSATVYELGVLRVSGVPLHTLA